MSKFHSTVSRRTFMKGLGLAGAGLGTAAAAAPVFHDLDELISSETAGVKRPWYVKNVDVPTIELDWTLIKRFDAPKIAFDLVQYIGSERYTAEVKTPGADYKKSWITDKKPGYTLRDFALGGSGSHPGSETPWVSSKYTDPSTFGVPKWQGTPEENARMMRSAIKFYGASAVGFTTMDADTKKLIYTRERSGAKAAFVFEGSTGYEADGKKVIPDSVQMTMIDAVVHQSVPSYACLPGALGQAPEGLSLRMVSSTGASMQRFLGNIGYQGLWACTGGGGQGPRPAFDTLSGLGEMSRDAGEVIIPEYGLPYSNTTLLTDLPIAPTTPIDAGIWRFCQTCKKCADVCPSGSIDKGDATWDITGPWNNPGTKKFGFDAVSCYSFFGKINRCMICMSSCVFTKGNSAGIHQVIKSVISTTSVFNGFFRAMDDTFDYGRNQFGPNSDPTTGVFNERATGWWDLELPMYGINSTIGATQGL